MQPVRMVRRKIPGNDLDQMRETIRIIGSAIQDGAKYLPIRNHAAALATTAEPKDYLGQLNAVYDSFVKNWRYVKDPFGHELVTRSPNALYNLVIGGGPNDPGIGRGKGAGDCDDATAALGAQLMSIGFPIRIAVTSNPGSKPGPYFSHVFAQASVPGVGWISVDPVPHPVHGLGYTPVNSRIAHYDLNGNLLDYSGNVRGLLGDLTQEVNEMETQLIPDVTMIPDWGPSVGLAGYDDGQEPLDWRQHVLKDFGIYSEHLGIMSGEGLNLAAEVEYIRAPDGSYVARTPMLELAPDDYAFVRQYKFVPHGTMALGDNGEIYRYEYSGLGGFFKRLFKKAKSVVKKVASKVGGAVKKVLKKIPGGKYLVKLGEKVWKIANKFVKPLIKFVGKYAAKLAPVAALIPGYGPAIAAGLYTAGRVANLMTKYGVDLVGEKGKTRKLKFKSGQSAKDFQKALKKEADKEVKKQKLRKKGKGKTRKKLVRARRAAFSPKARRAFRRGTTFSTQGRRPAIASRLR